MTKIRKKIGTIPINDIEQQVQQSTQAAVTQMQQDITDFINEETAQYPEIGGAFKFQEDPEERTEITTDAEGKIISYRDSNGVKHEEVGIETDKALINHLNLTDTGMSEFQQALKDAGFQPGDVGDWSDYVSNDGDNPLVIPVPKCAALNIISDFDLTKLSKASRGGQQGVDYEIPTEVEFYDMQGNYFKKWTSMSGQGDSSMLFKKKNIAFDFFDSEFDGDAFGIRFDNWVIQDSFHLKAYTNDAFRCVGLAAYKIYSNILNTRPANDRVPFAKLVDTWKDVDWSVGYDNMIDGNSNLTDNFDFEAKCMPDGFPVIVYQNGQFFGIYCWQIKKHRNNYHLDKGTATNVHLDGVLSGQSIWSANGDNTKIGWDNNSASGFEVRNPKDSNLILMDGTQYDADFNAGELIDETSEFYDATNKKHKISKNTKKCIVNLSKYMTELREYETAYNNAPDGPEKEAALSTLKEEIEKRFNVSFMIDYLIVINVLQDGDSVAKNWQWVTWNGIQWCPNLYDCDCSFGNGVGGNVLDDVLNILIGFGATDSPIYWVYTYYMSDIESRYSYLRSSGTITADKVIDEVKNIVIAIGANNYKREFKKWKDSPCNRPSGINSEYWELISNWAQGQVTYDSTRNYAVGDTCIYGSTTNIYWTYRFRCKKACQGEVPCITYDNEIAYLGRYDSLYRLYAWETQRIEALDSLLHYNNN